MERMIGGVSRTCRWVSRLAAANLLWLGLTLAGGVLVGLFPATVALYRTVQVWVVEPDRRDAPWVRGFIATALGQLGRANLVGYLWLAVVILLVIDFRLGAMAGGPAATVLIAGAVAGLSLCAVAAVHLPAAVLDRAGGSLREIMITALWSGLARPVVTVASLVGFAAISIAAGRYPGLAIFFGLSPVAALTTLLTYRRK